MYGPANHPPKRGLYATNISMLKVFKVTVKEFMSRRIDFASISLAGPPVIGHVTILAGTAFVWELSLVFFNYCP